MSKNNLDDHPVDQLKGVLRRIRAESMAKLLLDMPVKFPHRNDEWYQLAETAFMSSENGKAHAAIQEIIDMYEHLHAVRKAIKKEGRTDPGGAGALVALHAVIIKLAKIYGPREK